MQSKSKFSKVNFEKYQNFNRYIGELFCTSNTIYREMAG